MDKDIAKAAAAYMKRTGRRAVRFLPPCDRRSPSLGVRKGCNCPEGGDDAPVFVCGRSRRKVTPANCVLCMARDGRL